MIFGLKTDVIDLFSQYRFIMAGASGSIMHLGIGPIVTASIILQLFVGAKIINLDLTNAEDKAIYQGTQKILVIAMIFIEAIPQIFGYLEPTEGLINAVGVPLADSVIVLQLVIGALIVFLWTKPFQSGELVPVFHYSLLPVSHKHCLRVCSTGFQYKEV